jgi:hypothetical protein
MILRFWRGLEVLVIDDCFDWLVASRWYWHQVINYAYRTVFLDGSVIKTYLAFIK